MILLRAQNHLLAQSDKSGTTNAKQAFKSSITPRHENVDHNDDEDEYRGC